MQVAHSTIEQGSTDTLSTHCSVDKQLSDEAAHPIASGNTNANGQLIQTGQQATSGIVLVKAFESG